MRSALARTLVTPGAPAWATNPAFYPQAWSRLAQANQLAPYHAARARLARGEGSPVRGVPTAAFGELARIAAAEDEITPAEAAVAAAVREQLARCETGTSVPAHAEKTPPRAEASTAKDRHALSVFLEAAKVGVGRAKVATAEVLPSL